MQKPATATTPESAATEVANGVAPTPNPLVDVTFEIAGHALTSWGNHIYIVGGLPELGAWDPAHAVRLFPAAYPVWAGTVALPSSTAFEYKYICKVPGQAIVWEEPPYKNRTAETPDADQELMTVRDAWY